MRTVGERIKAARNAVGLRQADLADRLDVTRSAIAQWESGFTLPEANRLVDVSLTLGKSIDWILRGVSTPFISSAATSLNEIERRIAVQSAPTHFVGID
ncbi:helix-turn-helix transcriptional regulator [Mesorhizobium sp. CAU 1741]|uniref:helix-turn-helix domain-containing protein n=1 Tax=Mesorhizobium sp. CAU 1741 TaxID=3140366 RepID=UPI00325A97D2